MMTLKIAVAALAVFAVASPALAMRHADVVYLQMHKARQKLMVETAKTKTEARAQEVASAPVSAPASATEPAAAPAAGAAHSR